MTKGVAALDLAIAHDFDNLLAIIAGYGELLLQKFEEGRPWRDQRLSHLFRLDAARPTTIAQSSSGELPSRMKGRVWDDRWFGRALTSPRQVRNALVYVLANFRKHARGTIRAGIDPFSSGAVFEGFREWRPGDGSPPWAGRAPPPFRRAPESSDEMDWLVLPARSWLARAGWRRHGLVGLGEAPRSDVS